MEAEQKKQAMISALRLLAAGDKSERDLTDKLRQKGFSVAITQATLTQLIQEGLLSDHIFAQKLAERVLKGKRAGTHRLAFELKRKHIPENIRKQILSSVNPDEQRQQAFEIAALKVTSLRDTNPRILRKKLYDFLVRKGYDFQLAQDTAQAVLVKIKRGISDENESNP